MANPPPLRGGSATPRQRPVDDGWGPATAVRTGPAVDDGWSPAGPSIPAPPVRVPRPNTPRSARRRPSESAPPIGDAWAGPPRAPSAKRGAAAQRLAQVGRRAPTERGLPWVAALILLVLIAGLGGVIDTITGAAVRGAFNIGIIVASVVAILAVRRSGMFPIVIAPPLVYAIASAAMLYVRSGGLKDHHVLFDAAANWLVYGFPAIAAATAAVLVIAGVRLLIRR